ncbi:MAG: prepilin-type N-terminal cleavage/methylation domain-containing protein [Nitrosomonadaceae bacterium]|nr:prepilin-type N-terminal cleavage/methylation domain-containing protein [Nitrosomonadaceae bacterium]
MKKVQKGFTLIELMIVVAIIGILAAVAIPAYQDYIVKAKLSKVAASVDPVKLAVAMYFQEQGSMPSASNAWTSLGLPAAGPTLANEITSITNTLTTGALVVTLQNVKSGIDTTTITMTPSTTAGQTGITWTNTCTSTDAILKKYFVC